MCPAPQQMASTVVPQAPSVEPGSTIFYLVRSACEQLPHALDMERNVALSWILLLALNV